MMGIGPHVFTVWAYAIANASGGELELNPRYVSVLVGMSPEEVASAIEVLCAPDPASRSKVEEGRRLVRTGEFSYRLPNWAAYRAVRNEEERRAYNREKQAEHRAREAVKAPVNDTSRKSRKSRMSAHTEAETEAEAGKTPRSSRGDVGKPTWLTPYCDLWVRHYSAKMPIGPAVAVLKPLEKEHGTGAVLRALDVYLSEHSGSRAAFVSLPKFAATFGQWLNPTRPKSRQDRNFEAIDLGLPDEGEGV